MCVCVCDGGVINFQKIKEGPIGKVKTKSESSHELLCLSLSHAAGGGRLKTQGHPSPKRGFCSSLPASCIIGWAALLESDKIGDQEEPRKGANRGRKQLADADLSLERSYARVLSDPFLESPGSLVLFPFGIPRNFGIIDLLGFLRIPRVCPFLESLGIPRVPIVPFLQSL